MSRISDIFVARPGL